MKISVIIPAYNAKRTIERTVRNVLSSTIPLELWVVNDGSKDETGEILERLASELSASNSSQSVLKVVHQENQGAYAARLNAMRRITTPWFGFVDADDFISPDMFERMLALAEAHDLDVVECGFDECRYDDPGRLNTGLRAVEPLMHLSRQEVLGHVVLPTFVGSGKSAYVWNKIYRNQYDFGTWMKGTFGSYEDLIHNLQLFLPVKRFASMDLPFYHYAPNDGSITRRFSAVRIDHFAATVAAKRKLVAKYELKNTAEKLDEWVVQDAKNGVLSAATMGILPCRERLEFIERIVQLPEVSAALRRCPLTNPRAALLRLASWGIGMPLVWGLQILYRVHGLIRKLFV